MERSMKVERPYTRLLDQLRSAGLRLTRQRLALAKLLFGGMERHVTAEMLHGEAQEARVPVSLATVYNTLHQFTDAGLLKEIMVDRDGLILTPIRHTITTSIARHLENSQTLTVRTWRSTYYWNRHQGKRCLVLM